ncbi:unnamed protein product [Vicia faba]|uniref:FBD domain-containing protein n=1 Tax=Vicia faba TaxID=3906 RepID=A0AAV0YGU9_VICFA|nr:unnamed protein product [Vicia faba]
MLMNSLIVPHCLLYTLKVLKFKKFVGHVRGLSIARYILENGQVLERINFCLCSKEAQEEVLSFKKCSSSVILEFSSELFDLVITVNGKKEKIASGLFNPFHCHLKVAQYQKAKVGYSIVLVPEHESDATWFSRRTIERYGLLS